MCCSWRLHQPATKLRNWWTWLAYFYMYVIVQLWKKDEPYNHTAFLCMSFYPKWDQVVCFSDSWVHCNDTKMQMVSIDDVYKAQAYILIYTKSFHNENQLNETSNGVSSNTFADSNPSRIPKYCDLKRMLNGDVQSSFMWKKRKTTIW